MRHVLKRVRRAYRRWIDRQVWAAWCAEPVPAVPRWRVDQRIWRAWNAAG